MRVPVAPWLLCLSLLVGCESTERAQVDPPPAGASERAPTAPYAMDAAGRRAALERELGALGGTDGSSPTARALEAARIVTAMVRLGDSDVALGPVRAALREAASSGAGADACRAALELARLEAGPARDLAAAHAAARMAARRFASEERAVRCARDAQRMVATLAAHIHADPHGATGDAAAAGHGEVVGDAVARDWVEQQGEDDSQARLEEIAVYGADPAGERPLSDREVRVVLRFDGVAVYRRGALPATGGLPRRIFLDLDRVALASAVPKALEVGAGGLDRVRVVALDEATTRVSFDVGESTVYRLFFLSDPYRVVMDFRDQGRQQKGLAAAAGAPVIVLDPGHGGEQPGAKGPHGLKESQVALSLAKRVRASLRRQRPGLRALLTREDDRFLTLEERTAIANGYDADVFVSIHLNASHSSEDKGGVATFVLDTTNDQAALRLAARENGTDTAGVTQLQFILASLYRAEQVDHSLALANQIQRATLGGGRQVLPGLYDRGVKRALFYVLVGARMPAALVEASFITRPEEAKALHTDEYKDALAEGIAKGLVRYLDTRAKDGR